MSATKRQKRQGVKASLLDSLSETVIGWEMEGTAVDYGLSPDDAYEVAAELASELHARAVRLTPRSDS